MGSVPPRMGAFNQVEGFFLFGLIVGFEALWHLSTFCRLNPLASGLGRLTVVVCLLFLLAFFCA